MSLCTPYASGSIVFYALLSAPLLLVFSASLPHFAPIWLLLHGFLLRSQVKKGEYEGGFSIWECTWDLLGFLQKTDNDKAKHARDLVSRGHVLDLGKPLLAASSPVAVRQATRLLCLLID